MIYTVGVYYMVATTTATKTEYNKNNGEKK